MKHDRAAYSPCKWKNTRESVMVFDWYQSQAVPFSWLCRSRSMEGVGANFNLYIRVGTGRIFCIRSGPASFKICLVRSKSGRIIFDVNPAKIRQKNRKKSGFVRPDELFVRSCPIRPDRFQLWTLYTSTLLLDRSEEGEYYIQPLESPYLYAKITKQSKIINWPISYFDY